MDSPFGPVFVVDQSGERAMRFGAKDAADQSVIDLVDPARVPVEYVRAIAAMPVAKADAHYAVLGMGAGVLSRALLRAQPDARIDSVEINPVVVELARSHFDLRPDPRHFVHVADAAAWLAASEDHYDLIVIDVYSGDDIPAALASTAFFALAGARLRASGQLVMNVAMEDAADERALADRFAAALTRFVVDERRVEEGNLLLIATASGPS